MAKRKKAVKRKKVIRRAKRTVKRKRVSAINTVSRTLADKNRITANIQVGSIASHKKVIRDGIKTSLSKKLLAREMATTKTARKKLSKQITQGKRDLKKYM